MLIIRRRNIVQRANDARAKSRNSSRPFSMFSHGRSASDLSQRSFGNSVGHSDAMSLSGPQQQPVPGVHGMTYVPVSISSAGARHGHSYSVSTNSLIQPTNSRYTASPSPPPGMAFNHTSNDRANIIEPFMAVSQSPSPEQRKGSVGAVYPLYGAPSSPPDPVQRTPPETTTPQRRRINPPAYSVDHPATDGSSVIHTTRDDPPTTPNQNTTLTPTPSPARVHYPREKGGTDVRMTPTRDGNLSPPSQIVLSPPTRGLRPYAPSSVGPPMTTRDDNSTHTGNSR